MIAFLVLAMIAGQFARPEASRPSVVCPRLDGFVNVELGDWGGEGTGFRRERFALAGSEGANRLGGFMIFGSATPTTAHTDGACRRVTARPNPSTRRLSAPYFYRRAANGNAYFENAAGDLLAGERLRPPGHNDPLVNRDAWGISFRCRVAAGVTILITDSRDRERRVVGSYFSARLGRELLATAVLRTRGPSFFRISSRCRQR